MIRVLVVEDSAVVRELLLHVLGQDPDVEVVGVAGTGREAVKLTERLCPDVISMDIDLPEMDGLTATRHIMESSPRPIVLVTASYDPEDVEKSFEALSSGAVAICAKPEGPGSPDFEQQTARFLTTIKIMSEVRVVTRVRGTSARRAPAVNLLPAPDADRIDVVAIAASTGGPAALGTILRGLSGPVPVPIVIVQHMVSGFHGGLASWLSTCSGLPVRVGRQGEKIHAGEVVVAPPDHHLVFSSPGRLRLTSDPLLGGHRPSGDPLFRSVAQTYGSRAAGVILTGMGSDGVEGLAALREAGGRIIAQDEQTSVVYGMPKEASVRGLPHEILPVDSIAPALVRLWRKGRDGRSLAHSDSVTLRKGEDSR